MMTKGLPLDLDNAWGDGRSWYHGEGHATMRLALRPCVWPSFDSLRGCEYCSASAHVEVEFAQLWCLAYVCTFFRCTCTLNQLSVGGTREPRKRAMRTKVPCAAKGGVMVFTVCRKGPFQDHVLKRQALFQAATKIVSKGPPYNGHPLCHIAMAPDSESLQGSFF